MSIVILPLLNVSDQILSDLKDELGNTFLTKVRVERPLISLPDDTYDQERGQYDADILVPYLESQSKVFSDEKILAVGNIDLFLGDMNYIFGVAQKGGRLCVISLYRLDQRFYGKQSSYNKLKERAIKEAVHEIGHCYGLEHCKDRGCVMTFSTNIMSVDSKARTFCESCREDLRKNL